MAVTVNALLENTRTAVMQYVCFHLRLFQPALNLLFDPYNLFMKWHFSLLLKYPSCQIPDVTAETVLTLFNVIGLLFFIPNQAEATGRRHPLSHLPQHQMTAWIP